MPKKITNEMFVEALKRLHPNLIALSDYNGSKKDIVVRCLKHNYTFLTKPNYLMKGRGCKFCATETVRKILRKPIEKVIEDFNRVHNGKYTYPNLEDEYENNKSYITFICPIHGEGKIMAIKHLQGQGCKFCSHQSYKHTTETFIEQSNIVHNNRYQYCNTEYVDRNTKVAIICPIHGEFWQTPKDHLSGCGCPKCKESSLEREVRRILENNNIKYLYGFKKHTQLNKSVDFYLPDYKVAIECQGEQHFRPIEHFGGKDNFETTVKRDIAKFNELSSHNDNVIYITNADFKKDIDSSKFGNIYKDRTLLIEEISEKPSILLEKLIK